MESIIQVKNLSKTFENGVIALEDVSIDIHKGSVFGIIGMSGAGKSTLVRCLNYLEKPTSGNVIINGKDLKNLSSNELKFARTKIGMIFQSFNLLMQRNVIDNICFPMEILGIKKKDARKRAKELLDIVDLSDKEKAYPVQLSGGQKQRIAIARALANNPEILLCDEATSALDPNTTKSILRLLKEINEKYQITIVIITHEMAVIQEICTDVAILQNGKLVEQGSVTEIFTAPKTEEAKKLIFQEETKILRMQGEHCVRVVFSENSAFEPVIGNMILHFKTPVNILLADTKNINGVAVGEMILQLSEKEEIANQMIEYLKERKLHVEEVQDYVIH
ncbi:methionine ABC transporter ATP-binding protein [[Clostridium] fimetarium]|uniref:D-methionine transport system ATP-binding protein n=1 Tax=[Clostridium] fimetarium TaxID=99656 RepID=A0A1I0PMW4_9FIRM|nr:ATP-binding cassette domain-containing protein [[Clostridium] fimetarium]SEW15601.1 D-methionine transport system ATP-binding protein [[Clostridium] fimetarium]